MQDISPLMVGLGLLSAFLGGGSFAFLLRGRARNDKKDHWERRMTHLEEAVNRAGVLNRDFFHSLEAAQKRLELLLTRAEWAEQDLRRLLTQAASVGEKGAGRADQYATAASLLAEGEDAQQVARALKLPLAQVRLMQELRRELGQEKTAGAAEKTADLGNVAARAALVKNLVNRQVGSIRNGTVIAPEVRA